jgi:hypothetical protein
MKKLIMSLGLCVCIGFAAAAQDFVVIEEATTDNSPAFVNKRGIPLLPKAGDFAIGIDAAPFFMYFGNFFGKSNDNIAPSFEGVNQTIYGKYFLQDDRAIRAKLTVGFGKDKDKRYINNDYYLANDPLQANASVADIKNTVSQLVGLTAGYEFRRGRGRLQGFYGGEIGFAYSKTDTIYDFGNPMTDVNQSPTSGWSLSPSNRITEDKGGATFAVGLGAFAGIEYFVAPQISVGGELGIGFSVKTKSQGEITTESFNAASGKVETITSRQGGNAHNYVWFQTRPSGSLFLMFHF